MFLAIGFLSGSVEKHPIIYSGDDKGQYHIIAYYRSFVVSALEKKGESVVKK
jgi:hypothetical protein